MREKESFQQPNEHPLYTTCDASPQMVLKLFHGAKKERKGETVFWRDGEKLSGNVF